MRLFLRIWIAAILLLVSGSIAVIAQSFPPPQGYVSDFANLFDPTTRSSLESRLELLSKETGTELAVVTVITLDGDSIEGYAVRLFDEWGIGQAGSDNGVLFITALAERQVRIEVGYGLEPVITDGRAGRILDNSVLPSFREGDYASGIVAGVDALEAFIRSGSPPTFVEENPFRGLFGDLETLFFSIGLISMYMISWMARSKSIWLGGIWGALTGIVLGLATGNAWALLGITLGLTAVGLFLDAVVSRNYQTRTSSGLPTTWSASGGGFRSSSGSSSFGGFSGGRSGGGGASRGW
ncbi:TPM domain-containing protein [Dehalogenimonas sp. THU2]|uniref:TPM domain-containing protein n=1 Tax=Dehalogenimonas sp. THU2 TaxID=3151121 RepID=UPI0032188283